MIQMNIQMEEMRRDRYEGRERSLHSFSRYRSPHASTCSSAWKLSEPHAIRTFMEASSRKRDPSLTPPGTRLPPRWNPTPAPQLLRPRGLGVLAIPHARWD